MKRERERERKVAVVSVAVFAFVAKKRREVLRNEKSAAPFFSPRVSAPSSVLVVVVVVIVRIGR